MKWALAVSGVLVIFIAAACGGGAGPTVRTQKGLGVGLAAMAASGGQVSQAGSAASGRQIQPTPAYAASKSGAATGENLAYPQAPVTQQGESGVTVVGYGSASANADNALVELYFSRYGVTPLPSAVPKTEPSGAAGATGSSAQASQPAVAGPITETDLKPVIDAIAAKGVSRDDIEFIGSSYYDPYTSTATLRARVRDLGTLDGVVQAAQSAAANLAGITLQNTSVSYTLSDCTALEKAATKAAVDDASSRAKSFAEALGVGLGSLVGASNYSYSPYGGTTCDAGFIGPYPVGGYAYASGQPRTVQLFANVSVTYAIK